MGPERVTIRQAVHVAFFEQDDIGTLERVLHIPALSQDWRGMFQEQLRAVTSGETR